MLLKEENKNILLNLIKSNQSEINEQNENLNEENKLKIKNKKLEIEVTKLKLKVNNLECKTNISDALFKENFDLLINNFALTNNYLCYCGGKRLSYYREFIKKDILKNIGSNFEPQIIEKLFVGNLNKEINKEYFSLKNKYLLEQIDLFQKTDEKINKTKNLLNELEIKIKYKDNLDINNKGNNNFLVANIFFFNYLIIN